MSLHTEPVQRMLMDSAAGNSSNIENFNRFHILFKNFINLKERSVISNRPKNRSTNTAANAAANSNGAKMEDGPGRPTFSFDLRGLSSIPSMFPNEPPESSENLNENMQKSKKEFISIFGEQKIGEEQTFLRLLDLIENNLYPYSTLDLSNEEINDEQLKLLAKALEKNNSITHINLSHNRITGEGVRSLVIPLSKNRKIASLDLSHNWQWQDELGVNQGNIACFYLRTILESNKALTHINLGNNRIEKEGIDHLAEGLKKNARLIALNLAANDLDDGAVLALTTGIFENSTLSILDLSYNKITDLGAEHLAKLLTNSEATRIAILNLERNAITKTGGHLFVNALAKNKYVQAFGLVGNPIEGIEHQGSNFVQVIDLTIFMNAPFLIFNLDSVIQTIYADNVFQLKEVLTKNKRNLRISIQDKTYLHHALNWNKFDAAGVLLQDDPELINVGDAKGDTVLLHTIKHLDDPKKLKWILDHNPNLEVPDKEKRTALLCALLLGKKEAARALIARGANVNAVCTQGFSILHLVVINRWNMIPFFLAECERAKRVVDIYALDGSKRTALMHAAKNPDSIAVKALVRYAKDNARRLLQRSGDVSIDRDKLERYLNAQDNSGCTALMRAAVNDRDEIAVFLLKKGALFNIRDNEGKTAEMHAQESAQLKYKQAIANGASQKLANYMQGLRTFVQNMPPREAEAYVQSKSSAFMREIGLTHHTLLILQEAGKPSGVNKKMFDGIYANNASDVLVAIAEGADFLMFHYSGVATALMAAVTCVSVDKKRNKIAGKVDAVQALLTYSPVEQLAKANQAGRNALMLAIKHLPIYDNKPLLKVILPKCSKEILLMRDKEGHHALNYAILKEDIHAINCLLKQNVPEQLDGNDQGITSLMLAVVVGNIGIINLILYYCTLEQLLAKNKQNYTALMLAIVNKYQEEGVRNLAVVKALLGRKKDFYSQVMITDEQGVTPLMLAAAEGNVALMRVLLTMAKQEQMQAQDSHGFVAFDYAHYHQKPHYGLLVPKAEPEPEPEPQPESAAAAIALPMSAPLTAPLQPKPHQPSQLQPQQYSSQPSYPHQNGRISHNGYHQPSVYHQPFGTTPTMSYAVLQPNVPGTQLPVLPLPAFPLPGFPIAPVPANPNLNAPSSSSSAAAAGASATAAATAVSGLITSQMPSNTTPVLFTPVVPPVPYAQLSTLPATAAGVSTTPTPPAPTLASAPNPTPNSATATSLLGQRSNSGAFKRMLETPVCIAPGLPCLCTECLEKRVHKKLHK